MSQQQVAFETWGVVDVMGHQRFAGFISEQVVAGQAFVRVEVPEVPASYGRLPIPAYTKLLGGGSIYSITPCSEELARAAAASSHSNPLTAVELTEEMVRSKAARLGLVDPKALPNASVTAGSVEDDEDDFEDDRDFDDV